MNQAQEVIILDFTSGTVSIHPIPAGTEDADEYIKETLDVDSDCEYMITDKIVIDDFRGKGGKAK